MELINDWLANSQREVKVLPPSNNREQCLYQTQVSTRSPMGALVYETGGIVIDNGWIRFLGSGDASFNRTLPEWNSQHSTQGFFLIADDALGSFFALNGGGLGSNIGKVYYLPYDSLSWETTEHSFSSFFQWCLNDSVLKFYGEDHWSHWASYTPIKADECFSFYPFLWTAEGNIQTSQKKSISISEAYIFKLDTIWQLQSK